MFRKLRRKLRRRGAKVGAAKLARASRRGSKAAASSLGKAIKRVKKTAGSGISAAAKARQKVRGMAGAIGKARATAGKMVKKPLRRPGKPENSVQRRVKENISKFRKRASDYRKTVKGNVKKTVKGNVKRTGNIVKKVTGAQKKVRRKLFGGVRRRLKRRFGFDAGGRYEQKMMMGGKMTGADKDFMGGGMMKDSYGHGGKKKSSYSKGGKMNYPGGGHMGKPKSGGSYRQLD